MLSYIRQKLTAFIKSEDGITAVEFSLVGMPFMILMLGIIEVGLAFAASSLLEGGTNAAARMVRTGQVQESADPEGSFRSALCDHVASFINCDQIVYEVIEIPDNDFQNAGTIAPNYDAEEKMVSGGFSPGEENSVVLIRSFYDYNFITFQLANLMSQGSSNGLPLMTTMVIKNEPYNF